MTETRAGVQFAGERRPKRHPDAASRVYDGEAFIAMYGLERACQAQLQAMACNTALTLPPPDVVAKSSAMYAPGASRRYGALEWPPG